MHLTAIFGASVCLLKKHRTALILAAATLTALCLGTIRLGHQPLYIEEAGVFFWANHPIRTVADNFSSQNAHGPFYFLIMAVWRKLGLGGSEFGLRFFSALCFAPTVPVVYLIGRAVSGRRAGLYAAWLTATAPFLINHAQQARMYTLLTFFCSLSLMTVALIISRQTEAPPPVIGAGLRSLWRRRTKDEASCL